MLVIGDKTQFMFEYQHSTQWSVTRDEIRTRLSQTIGTKEGILRVIWGIDGFHVFHMLPSVGCFNTEYFLIHIMDPLLVKVFPEGRKTHALRLSVHPDNC
jgi:hypothetical protein